MKNIEFSLLFIIMVLLIPFTFVFMVITYRLDNLDKPEPCFVSDSLDTIFQKVFDKWIM